MNPVITCETALRLIDSFVSDELAPEDARLLADHLRACPSCSAEGNSGESHYSASARGCLPRAARATFWSDRAL